MTFTVINVERDVKLQIIIFFFSSSLILVDTIWWGIFEYFFCTYNNF